MPSKNLSIISAVAVAVFLVAGVVVATTTINTNITTSGDPIIGLGTFAVHGEDGLTTIGPDNFIVDGDNGDTMIIGTLQVAGGINNTVIGQAAPLPGFFTSFQAGILRVTSAPALTAAEVDLTKTEMQAASFWPVDISSNSVDIVLSESLDAADVGRRLIFSAVTNGSGHIMTVSSGGEGGITVTAKGGYGNDAMTVGDFIECLITSDTKATCTLFGTIENF